MYESHFGFECSPFANIPDPRFLYPSSEHKKALSILQYALMARAGFCVITGNVGAGKTTLVRNVLSNLDQPMEVGLVSNTKCETFEELLRWILLAFGLDYKGKDKVEMYDDFVSFLVQCHESGRPVTLIVDEAQHLGAEYLEQIRMLSNVNTEKGQILQTILVGQPELWNLLKQPELRQFAQRISYDYFLSPLHNSEECGRYISYRLETAGGNSDIFDSESAKVIWQATNGVPRLINLICDTALVYAFAEEKVKVDVEIVKKVIEDKESSFSPIGKAQISEELAVKDAQNSASEPRKAPTTPKTRMSIIEKAARLNADS